MVRWSWIAASLLLVSGVSAQGVMVNYLGLTPAAPKPGEAFTVDFEWLRDGNEPEQRLVFLADVHDHASSTRLSRQYLDPAGHGVREIAGTSSLNFTAPATESSIDVHVYAAPWSLNRWVVEKYKSYPTDGTYTYEWTSGHYGVTQDLYYLGSRIAVSSGRNVTYCSGVAFETFLLCSLDYNTTQSHPNIGGLTWSQMEGFRRIWYGTNAAADPELKLAALAIPQYGLGDEITDWDEVQEGDFVQLWRWSGSGHNPLFVGWVRNGSGTITGLRYWGSQSSTNGIGIRTESFGDTSGVRRDKIYFGRVRKPRDEGDVTYALGSASALGIPISSQVPVAPHGWMAF
ncbi:hypothetical protein GC173_05150 [bacterium]|nr:hypothetical protein [bacterium]